MTIKTVWQKFLAFCQSELGAIEHWAEEEWKALIVAFKPFTTQLTAGQYLILTGLAQKALQDLGSGDYAGLVQHVIQQAEVQELQWVLELGEDFLVAVIAVTSANAKAAQGQGA